MSFQILILAIIDAIIFGLGLIFIFRGNEEKKSNLEHYSTCIHELFQRNPGLINLFCAFHYLSLHLLFPLWGLAFLLKSDINFLVILVGILLSMQFTQRIYPGFLEEDLRDDNEEE